jgi:hemolysin III
MESGLVGAIIGTAILLRAAVDHGDSLFLIGAIIFTTTMLLVYLASTLDHGWPHTDTKSLLQVMDHASIFLLIAERTRHLPCARYAVVAA